MAKTSKWVVTSTGKRSFAAFRKDLQDAGFKIDQAMEEIGVITGNSDDAIASKLRGLEGVADVAKEGDIDIGPPDADKTW